jgi:chemotaxis protein MotB
VRKWIALVVAALFASGCVVSRATYEAELATGESLRHELELRELRISELEARVRDLEATRETLELEHQSLGEERLQLIDDLNELRSGNDELRAQLDAEREVRQQQETEIVELGGTYQRLVDQLEREVANGQIEIQRLQGQLHVRALEKILFDSGSTTIKPEGAEVLAKVAAQIQQVPDHRVRVEGHTDTVPIATAHFPSNWELSAARAAGVVRFLIENGVDAALLEAVGRGALQPIADNETREGRARNRRIEIVLVPDEAG